MIVTHKHGEGLMACDSGKLVDWINSREPGSSFVAEIMKAEVLYPGLSHHLFKQPSNLTRGKRPNSSINVSWKRRETICSRLRKWYVSVLTVLGIRKPEVVTMTVTSFKVTDLSPSYSGLYSKLN